MTGSVGPSAGGAAAPHVVVVGGGIAGLTAALAVRQGASGPVDVTVLEADDRIGGKLAVSSVAGIDVDEGAESLLARRREALDLVAEVGLSDRVVTPAVRGATVWTSGGLRRLPSGQLMGIPTNLHELAASGVLSLTGLMRIPLDHVLPATEIGEDIAIGRYVASRLGREVVDRLVEPLLGGVYAGHADDLSMAATLPQLAAAARVDRSLLAAARRVQAEGPAVAGSAFSSLAGGLGTLPPAVARASGARVRTGMRVTQLSRAPGGWRVVVGSGRRAEETFADAVVLAVPAYDAAQLLARAVPGTTADLQAVDYASVALVTLVFPRAAFGAIPEGSGFLVPPVEGRVIKAATYSSLKWGWMQVAYPDYLVVRCSIGRYGESHDLERDDDELAWLALCDLETATDVSDAPIGVRVTRWQRSLPQYFVGHPARVARVRSAVEAQPGLALCGAAYDGVGIPAVVASARTAARRVVRGLEERRQWAHG